MNLSLMFDSGLSKLTIEKIMQK